MNVVDNQLIVDGKLVVVTSTDREVPWGSDRSVSDEVRACRVFDPELCRLVLENMRTWREPNTLEREKAEVRLHMYYLENIEKFKVRVDNRNLTKRFPTPKFTADLVDPNVGFEILGETPEKIVSFTKGPNTFNM